ncbi:hypothetical protein IEC97_24455 [Neobacillus cucumis]|uniref:hypothetical protein n=1 Tax=Neobacillus cucumis TaxID=1740721 RepID=UPI0018DF0D01|nr:hypothetical protein [Neobacillus cucumis]MBI0580504.1 hypothetical protein [Neobacillus cucumis]
MPKRKNEELIIKEKNLMGEVEKVHLPRDKNGRFTSKVKTGEELKQRSIKLVKVKGSYGSLVVKEKLLPDEIRSILFGVAIIGFLIAVL